jgi:Homeodomain-like domain
VTHVLLLVDTLLRRADTAAVIGSALLAKAAGQGHRCIATRLGRAPSTVRGWLRRFGSRAESVRAAFTALAVTLVVDAVLPEPAGGVFADAVAAVGAAASAAARRFGVAVVSGWRLATAVSNGRLLAPGWPGGSCNTGWPWAAAM